MQSASTGVKTALGALSPGAKVGIALWLGAVAWDFVCDDKQTISHAAARGLRDPHTRVPIAAVAVMSITHVVAMAMGYGYEKETHTDD